MKKYTKKNPYHVNQSLFKSHQRLLSYMDTGTILKIVSPDGDYWEVVEKGELMNLRTKERITTIGWEPK